MTHKKYRIYTLILLIITVTALVVTAAMLSFKKDAVAAQGKPVSPPAAGEEPPNEAYYTPNPASSQENSKTSWAEGYIVTLHQGRIGVFPAGENHPVLTTGIEAYLLPHEDLELLQKGIWAKNLNEAKRILEDYD